MTRSHAPAWEREKRKFGLPINYGALKAMNMKIFYGFLCVLGTALPYGAFIPWVLNNGLNVTLMLEEIVNSELSLFAWLDVAVSALVLFGFIFAEGRKLQMDKLWIPVLGTCTVGVSLGLPLFLLLRESHLNKSDN